MTLASVRGRVSAVEEPPAVGRTALLGVQGRTGAVRRLTAVLRPGTGRFTLVLSVALVKIVAAIWRKAICRLAP